VKWVFIPSCLFFIRHWKFVNKGMGALQVTWRLGGMTLGGNMSLIYNNKIMQVAALTHIPLSYPQPSLQAE